MSGISVDSEVASETRADLRRCVTRAYPAFALPVRDEAMVVVIGLEIQQFIFQICTRPEQRMIQYSRRIVPMSLSTNGWDKGT